MADQREKGAFGPLFLCCFPTGWPQDIVASSPNDATTPRQGGNTAIPDRGFRVLPPLQARNGTDHVT